MGLKNTYYVSSFEITKLAVPLILTNFAYVALTTIDVVVLGKLGAVELAAGGLAITLFNQFKTTATGLITGLSNLVASEKIDVHSPNTKHYELLTAGIFWALVTSVLSIACLFLIEKPLIWLGQKQEVVQLTLSFLLIVSPGMIPALLIQVFRHFTTGLKRPGPLLLMTILSVGISVLSNYVLVFGHMGFSPMGLAGVAISTLVTLVFSLLIFCGFLWKDEVIRPYLKLSRLKLEKSAVLSVFKLGLPIATTYAAEAGFFTVLALIVGTLSVEALAVQTVIAQIMYIVFMIPAGFSHSVSVHISDAISDKQWDKAKIYGRSAMLITLLTCILIAIFYWLLPNNILSLFIDIENTSSVVVQLMIHGLMFASILQLFDAMQNIGTGLLRGVNDTVTPMTWSLVGYWLVGIPAAWFLGVILSMNIYGIWFGLGLGLALTGIALFLIFEKRLNYYD